MWKHGSVRPWCPNAADHGGRLRGLQPHDHRGWHGLLAVLPRGLQDQGHERERDQQEERGGDDPLWPVEDVLPGRYRHWKLGEDIDLIVCCEHDAVMTGAKGEVSFINVKTLNEWDSRYCNGVDWRQKLDSQRGAVLATELKNNSYKLARWTCCAMLAGSEYLKLGYVSRYHVKDSARHVILGTQQFKPNEFASQINLSMENAWGILRCVIDICRKLDEGKYLILNDPNKQVIRVYSLPDGTFSSDEEEEEEDEDEEEEEEEDEDN
ncbi:eukaryotic translation initiation factor 3 subunit D-like isoform X2 [Takifugu rubripes]|uniref:eukaryotic translation initiation factor 3 subunit D-like isoform X2 n=1 Tax=Takifugu rubripes TaxID=31033 RepID=UPI0011457D94|nr:eukaryotic translation initiation factor 3 subunit D-like isoform X2 [Takifugu rubripes]